MQPSIIIPQGVMRKQRPNRNIYMPSLRSCRCQSRFCSQSFIGELWKQQVKKDGKPYRYSSSRFGLSQGSAESFTSSVRATKNGWLKRITSKWSSLRSVIIEYLFEWIWCLMLIKSVSLTTRHKLSTVSDQIFSYDKYFLIYCLYQ